MKLADITTRDIHDLADSAAIIQRGIIYHRQGKVKSLAVKGESISAKVRGRNGTYDVEIYIDDSDLEADCDCPYPGLGCKHIVAVLYSFLEIKKSSSTPKKNSLKKSDQLQKKTRWNNLTFERYTEGVPTNILLEALELFENNEALITKQDTYKVQGKAGRYDVMIECSPWSSSMSSYCQCLNSYSQSAQPRCKHVVAVGLTLLASSGMKIPAGLKEQLQLKLQDERMEILLKNLNMEMQAQQQEQCQQKYGMFFKIQKEGGNLVLTVEKAVKLKHGGFGKPTLLPVWYYKHNFSNLPAELAVPLKYMFENLDTDSYYGPSASEKFVKKDFSSLTDIKIFDCLRQVYQENQEFFPDCSLPKDKAKIEISIEKTEAGNVFQIFARIKDTVLPLSNRDSVVVGKDGGWIYTRQSLSSRGCLCEVEAGKQDLLRKLIDSSGVILSDEKLPGFIEKYYLFLSSL